MEIINALGVLLLIAIPISFWVVMLVHASQSKSTNQTFWIIIILVAGIFGAIAYFLLEYFKKPIPKKSKK